MPEQKTPQRRGRPPAGAREAILAAASDLIRDQGLASLTTREVSRRAGVSEASVFYHFADKAGLLEQVVLAALTPLTTLPTPAQDDNASPSLVSTLLPLAEALEAFFDDTMAVLAAVQSDAALRRAFAARLVRGDLGPHRGLQWLSSQLAELTAAGRTRPGTDPDTVSMLLLGACFLRSWERQLTGAQRAPALPGMPAVADTLAALLAPGAAS